MTETKAGITNSPLYDIETDVLRLFYSWRINPQLVSFPDNIHHLIDRWDSINDDERFQSPKTAVVYLEKLAEMGVGRELAYPYLRRLVLFARSLEEHISSQQGIHTQQNKISFMREDFHTTLQTRTTVEWIKIFDDILHNSPDYVHSIKDLDTVETRLEEVEVVYYQEEGEREFINIVLGHRQSFAQGLNYHIRTEHGPVYQSRRWAMRAVADILALQKMIEYGLVDTRGFLTRQGTSSDDVIIEDAVRELKNGEQYDEVIELLRQRTALPVYCINKHGQVYTVTTFDMAKILGMDRLVDEAVYT